MFDFMIQHAYTNPFVGNKIDNYFLSNYNSTETDTAYRIMREDIKAHIAKKEYTWLSVSLVWREQKNIQVIFQMKGNEKWLDSVEYFRKFLGDMGGSVGAEPVSYGFIDQIHNIRVEFENGTVNILEL